MDIIKLPIDEESQNLLVISNPMEKNLKLKSSKMNIAKKWSLVELL